jgi:hypothetical protein
MYIALGYKTESRSIKFAASERSWLQLYFHSYLRFVIGLLKKLSMIAHAECRRPTNYPRGALRRRNGTTYERRQHITVSASSYGAMFEPEI